MQAGVTSFGSTGAASLQNVARQAGGLGSVFKGLVGGASFTVLAREILAYAQAVAGLVDEYSKIQNQLRLVTFGSENLARVQGELFDLAQETRSPLESTAVLYARIARNAAELGLTQQQLLDVTRTVNQAIQVSGGTASEASAGVVQFAQALASGVLRGDELRSMMENMPRLSQALADGLGVSIGQLREMGEAGELTSERVIAALQKSAPAVAAEFEKLTPTIGAAFTVLRNSIVDTIGKINESTGVGREFAQVVIHSARFVRELGAALTGMLQPTQNVSSEMQVFATILLTVYSVLESIVTIISGVLTTAFKTAGDFIAGLSATIGALLRGEFDEAKTIAAETFGRIGENLYNGFVTTTETLIGDMSTKIERIVELWDKGARDAAPAQAQLAGADVSKKRKEQSFADIVAEINANDPFAGMRNAPVLPEFDFRETINEQGEDNLKAIAEFSKKQWDKIKFDAKSFTEETSQYAKAAAENIQGAFADFLFDPFSDGLDGMLQGFAETMRRIAAEALAAKAMQAVSGFLSNSGNPYLAAFGNLLGGRAEGGNVQKGVPYMINERSYQSKRPEVFVPNRAGKIMDQSRLEPSAPTAQAPPVVVVQDESQIANALLSHRGTQEAQFMFISSHKGKIRSLLGINS
ncbi:MAG TPA: tape measure protein [Gammaproteobacteria bacterium]|nr:tape measure protein [Gammaproteobacteria bacterium]